MADVGLVGYPSAGKSSLVAAVSAARPKIADYPFTTLVPNLGVVEAGDVRFTVADVPGLIEGASEGRGLGHEFLRHVERCKVLVHVVDCATMDPGRDPIFDVDVIERELESYGGLADRPRMVALNKIDVPDARTCRDGAARARSAWVAGGAGFRGDARRFAELTFTMAEIVSTARASAPPAEPTRIILRPQAVDDAGFTVSPRAIDSGCVGRSRALGPADRLFQRRGGGYLADRLARLGVEDALLTAGATAGAEVVMGDDAVVFDWEPTIQAGAELLPGRRGLIPAWRAGDPHVAGRRSEGRRQGGLVVVDDHRRRARR